MDLIRSYILKLDAARDNQVKHFAGQSLVIRRSSSLAANIDITVMPDQQAMTYYPGDGFEADTFKRIYITHAAQPGEWVEVCIYGYPGIDGSGPTVIRPIRLDAPIVGALAGGFVSYEQETTAGATTIFTATSDLMIDAIWVKYAAIPAYHGSLNILDSSDNVVHSIAIPDTLMTRVKTWDGLIIPTGYKFNVTNGVVSTGGVAIHLHEV